MLRFHIKIVRISCLANDERGLLLPAEALDGASQVVLCTVKFTGLSIKVSNRSKTNRL